MTESPNTPTDIEHRFGYHRATFPVGYDPKTNTPPLASMLFEVTEDGATATAPTHAAIRQEFIRFAEILMHVVPAGREQALVLTKLQEASMWANAAVAMQSPLVRE